MVEPTTTTPAWSTALNSVLPVVTLVLGWYLSTVSDRFQHRRLRRDQIVERRADFQRQTLLELQEAMLGLIHAHDDEPVSEKDGKQKRFDAQMRITMLSARVHDPELRELALKFRTRSVESEKASDDVFASAVDSMQSAFTKAQNRTRELLLAIDNEANL